MIKNEQYTLLIHPQEDYLDRISGLVHSISRKSDLSIEVLDIIELSIVEACHNALRHGSQGNDPISLEISLDESKFKAIISNKGDEIDFDQKVAFDVKQDFLSYKNGGLGIPLIKKLMDSVIYERVDESVNKMTLIKYFNKGI